jgi:hypothetical protein
MALIEQSYYYCYNQIQQLLQYDTNYITLDLNVLKAHLSNFLLLFGINEVTVMVRIPTDLPL